MKKPTSAENKLINLCNHNVSTDAKVRALRKHVDRSVRRRGSFVLRKDVQRDHLAFLGALDRTIEFHRTNTNDPHNVGNAVIVAVTEVRDAFKAYIC